MIRIREDKIKIRASTIWNLTYFIKNRYDILLAQYG